MTDLAAIQNAIRALPPSAQNALLIRLRRLEARNRLLDYVPYAKQRVFHAAGRVFRERLLMAGNQLGKTLAGANETAMHLTGRYPSWWEGKVFTRPITGWAASETTEVTRDGVQRLLMGRPNHWGQGTIPADAIYDWKKRQHGAADALENVVVRWGGGGDVQAGLSVLGFKSYDQGRTKFQAETLELVWFDEEPDQPIYTEGLTRTNTTKGIVFMTFTPLKGMSETVKRFLLTKPPGTNVTSMTIDDVDHYTAEEREAIVSAYPEHEREARARGIPTLGSGNVYPVAEKTISRPRFQIPSHFVQIGGIDFGWDHPSGGVKLAWDRDADTIFVTHAHRMTKASPVLFSAAVRPWGLGPGGKQWLPWAWPHDGSAEIGGKYGAQDTKKLAQLYAEQGLLMLARHATHDDGEDGKPGSIGVEPGVMGILDMMQTGHFFVFDDLLDWWEEFRLYHRKDGRIVKLNDDLMSATRYAWMMRRYAMSPPRAARAARASENRSWRTV